MLKLIIISYLDIFFESRAVKQFLAMAFPCMLWHFDCAKTMKALVDYVHKIIVIESILIQFDALYCARGTDNVKSPLADEWRRQMAHTQI